MHNRRKKIGGGLVYSRKKGGIIMAQTSFPVIDLKATGERIKEIRQQKGITVKTLQTFLGFNEPVSIYKWQRGECLPTFDNMYAMACLFGVGIDDLLVGNRQEVIFIHIRQIKL